MNESTWSKFSAISEIVSSLAILITLAYLAIQTSQNTAAIQSSARQESLNNELWYLEMQINYPYLIGSSEGYSNLDPEQIKQLGNMYIALFRMRENLYLQYMNGVIDSETWDSYQSTFVRFLDNVPSMRNSWNMLEPSFNSEFVNAINKELDN